MSFEFRRRKNIEKSDFEGIRKYQNDRPRIDFGTTRKPKNEEKANKNKIVFKSPKEENEYTRLEEESELCEEGVHYYFVMNNKETGEKINKYTSDILSAEKYCERLYDDILTNRDTEEQFDHAYVYITQQNDMYKSMRITDVQLLNAMIVMNKNDVLNMLGFEKITTYVHEYKSEKIKSDSKEVEREI